MITTTLTVLGLTLIVLLCVKCFASFAMGFGRAQHDAACARDLETYEAFGQANLRLMRGQAAAQPRSWS